MGKARFCDRCGKKIPNNKCCIPSIYLRHKDEFDLCGECRIEFDKFMEG